MLKLLQVQVWCRFIKVWALTKFKIFRQIQVAAKFELSSFPFPSAEQKNLFLFCQIKIFSRMTVDVPRFRQGRRFSSL